MKTLLYLALICMSALAAGAAAAGDKIVIAHRGASGYLPEHTLAAKVMAHAMGADYIEQDVVLSKDGVPLVLHDIYLDTVTDVVAVFPERKRGDGRYYAIDFTLDEIKSLRANERISLKTGKAAFENRFPRGKSRFEVPTLADEIELIQGLNRSTGREAGIYPEIKAPAWHRQQGHDISRIVLDLLARYGYSDKKDRIYLQCFDWNETQRIRNELGYKGKLVQLIGENRWAVADTDYEFLKTREGLQAVARTADGIGPWMPHIVEHVGQDGKPVITDLVKNAHELGLEVHAYTFRNDALPDYVSDPNKALRIFYVDADVDGIFTDFPDQAVGFLRQQDALRR